MQKIEREPKVSVFEIYKMQKDLLSSAIAFVKTELII